MAFERRSRAICAGLAGLLPVVLVIGCRQQPAPEHPWYAGEAIQKPVVRPTLPRATLPTRAARAVITEPEPCRGTFGTAIACVGNTVVVGASEAGASGKVWIYDAARLDAAPTCLLPPKEAVDWRFGAAVAISPSGDRVAVGSPRAPLGGAREMGRVDVWRREGDRWMHEHVFTDPDTSSEFQHLGASVALDGECVIAGAPDASMTIVDNVLETRMRRPRPVPGDPMPKEAPDAMVETVQTPTIRQNFMREGVVMVWELGSNGVWAGPEYCFLTRGRPMARFGTALAQSGTQTIVSAPPQMTKYGLEGGTISVFIRRPGSRWRPEANAVIAPQVAEASDLFGSSIATAPGLAVAGIPNANTQLAVDTGRVLVFQQNVASRLWLESAPIESPAPEVSSNFGYAVAVWGDRVIVGQPEASRIAGSGTVFAFEKRITAPREDQKEMETLEDRAIRIRLGRSPQDRTAWEVVEEWTAPAVAALFKFGSSLATSADWAVVGAPGDPDKPGHVVLFDRAHVPGAVAAPSHPTGPRESPQEAAPTPSEPDVAPAKSEETGKPLFEPPPAYPGSSL